MKHLKRAVVYIIYILFMANSTLAGELKRMPIMAEEDLKMKTILRYKELWSIKIDQLSEHHKIAGMDGSEQDLVIWHEPTYEQTFAMTKEILESLDYDFEKTIIYYILVREPITRNPVFNDTFQEIERDFRTSVLGLKFGVEKGLVSKEALRAKELMESIKVSIEPNEVAALEGFVGCMKTKDVLTKAQVKECIRKKLPKNTKAKVDDLMDHLLINLSSREVKFVYVDDQKNTVEILKPEGIEEQYNLLKEYNVMKQKYK